MQFQKIRPEELAGNMVDKIGRQWMTVGTAQGERVNLMTASWGGIGVLWGKPSAFIFVRHSRHTHHLLENSEGFSLAFYGDSYREQLAICGNKSGRDIDKMAACGFTAAWDKGIPYPEQAETVLLCKKIGKAPLGPDTILDPSTLEKFYADNDFHDLYIAEIQRVLIKE